MPGVLRGISGDQWEFYLPILEGDTLRIPMNWLDVQVKESQMGRQIVIQYHDIKYYNQDRRGWLPRRMTGA